MSAPVVRLSYEEKIINALMALEYTGDPRDVIGRFKQEFAAIRTVLKPLYKERDTLRELLRALLPFAETRLCEVIDVADRSGQDAAEDEEYGPALRALSRADELLAKEEP